MKRASFSKRPKGTKCAARRTVLRMKGKIFQKSKKVVGVRRAVKQKKGRVFTKGKRVVKTGRAVKQRFGLLTVHRMYPDKTSDIRQQTIRVGRFEVEPARVGISYGITLNMTNYQFARATVSVELPCYVEEKEAALSVAEHIVSQQIQREIESLDAQRKKYGLKPAEVIGEPEPLISFLK